ncbi:hypothetical protein M758_2G125500 [Ceratodon purpureus]|nr:hypothetical protein M758_2G125500 [Ceratodon purpureus]
MQPPCSLMMLQKDNNKSSNLHHYKHHDAAFQGVYYVTKFAEDIYRLTLSRQTQSPSMFPINNQILSNRVWVSRLQKTSASPLQFSYRSPSSRPSICHSIHNCVTYKSCFPTNWIVLVGPIHHSLSSGQ